MYQTRRFSGELREFKTFTEAYRDTEDSEVWKLSWSTQEDHSIRIRLIRDNSRQSFYLEMLS